MEHFSVVQSLIRAALRGDRPGALKQVERLQARLLKGGDKDAEVVARLLSARDEAKNLEPSRIEISRSLVVGERLTSEVNPPIDRETGAKLCVVEFPTASSDGPNPVHDAVVGQAISGMLEEWSNPGRLVAMGVEPTRSLLIFGPPGSGKTMTARHLAQRLRLPLVTARIDGLIGSFLGTTARNIANLFDFANRYACVLLLDEFDALAKLRDDPHEVGEIKRVVNTLLQNLDARRAVGITIAITNHDQLLDAAVWRRFETQLHMGPPLEPLLSQLIERFLAPLPLRSELTSIFAYCLSGGSGADIQRICDAVKRTLAVRNDDLSDRTIFSALAAVLSRLPMQGSQPARWLARGIDEFVSYATNDKTFKMSQQALGEIVGKSQFQISRIKTDAAHLKSQTE